MWQVLQLTNSTLQVGLVGLAEALALLLLAPLGGAIADRMDRRTLLQTDADDVVAGVARPDASSPSAARSSPGTIYLAVVAISAAQSFEGPARQALIPALVQQGAPRRRVRADQSDARAGDPARSAPGGHPASGPSGPGYVYAFDALTYGSLVLMLGLIPLPRIAPRAKAQSVWRSIVEGFKYVTSAA